MEDEDMAKLTDESVVDLQFDVDGSVDEEWFCKTLGEWATAYAHHRKKIRSLIS